MENLKTLVLPSRVDRRKISNPHSSPDSGENDPRENSFKGVFSSLAITFSNQDAVEERRYRLLQKHSRQTSYGKPGTTAFLYASNTWSTHWFSTAADTAGMRSKSNASFRSNIFEPSTYSDDSNVTRTQN